MPLEREGRRRRQLAHAVVSVCALALCAPELAAQVRGQPVFFEPAYAYDARVGIDAGHFGEAGESTVTASGSVHIWAGNCRRFSISGAAGAVNPRGPIGARFTGAVGAQVLLNPCPSVLSVSALTFRFITGAGLVRGDGQSAWNVPVGLGAGLKLEIPVVQIEPWVVAHALFRERFRASGQPPAGTRRGGSWTGMISAGVTFGLGELAGLRLAGTCCRGGVGLGYGVSFWF